jgi:murein DD-endopeptidase MepM/ murein hydrolase activator NlpD
MVQRFPSAQPHANRRIGMRLVFSGKTHDRHIEIGRTPLILGGLCVILLSGWYLVATAYLIFRDEMLAGLLQSQAEMQYSYEDRIASLRTHLDRVASRQLVDQDSFEGRLNELLVRQSKLETRNAVLAALASSAKKSGIKVDPALSDDNADPDAASLDAPDEAAAAGKSKPRPEGIDLGRQSAIKPFTGSFSSNTQHLDNGLAAADSVKTQVAAVDDSLLEIEKVQSVALARLEQQVSKAPRQFRAVLDDVGLSAARFRNTTRKTRNQDAVGGPLLPLKGESRAFAEQIGRIQTALNQQASFAEAMRALPLRRPVPASQAITSGFGPRSDPFLARAAMHTGIDFRGDTGDAARATAPGRVTEVGVNGGYGKMVEIDHGYGLTTRYAHLSAFDVETGDIVERGQIIGRVGSTGRSTGPHLHYEIRIDGEAVDPMRFLRAAKHMK